ncbi:MAG TPA: FkbM family methyltransferase [Solirubrobacteraceae bacterium]|jgi:FkbM family methyltransferase
MTTAKLRPAKIRAALRRRRFELRVPHTPYREAPGGTVDLGTAYGGWMVPRALIEPSWLCYCVGTGGDISFDLALIERYDVRVRAFDAVEGYVLETRANAGHEPRLTAHHAAIALADGPLLMQVSHDAQSRSVSAAGLYESENYVELPGRTLASLMAELGDERIDLLKLDIEGVEYDLLEELRLSELGVKVFAVQLHHTGSVRRARHLIAQLREDGYEPVACRPAVKMTFVHRALLSAAPRPSALPARSRLGESAREGIKPRVTQPH